MSLLYQCLTVEEPVLSADPWQTSLSSPIYLADISQPFSSALFLNPHRVCYSCLIQAWAHTNLLTSALCTTTSLCLLHCWLKGETSCIKAKSCICLCLWARYLGANLQYIYLANVEMLISWSVSFALWELGASGSHGCTNFRVQKCPGGQRCMGKKQW